MMVIIARCIGITYIDVVLLALRVRALWHDGDAACYMPRQNYLHRSDLVFAGELDDCGVIADSGVPWGGDR